MSVKPVTWLFFITNLSGRNATQRMRIWRALKAAGAGLLRDGVYVLPESAAARSVFEDQAQEIRAVGGSGHILSLSADSSDQSAALLALFDRTAEYATAMKQLNALKREFAKLSETEARQRLVALNRDVATLVGRDFFPGKSREQMQGALEDAEAALNARFAPDEPRRAHLKIKSRDLKDYRGRTWATREHVWVDRAASAWLIRRFIDPQAKFIWLKHIKDCPKKALGFDFDGAEFTHIASKVTFEVLLASFGLEHDVGLARLGALVHHLDVGGIPVAEGAGLSTIMAGARASHSDDHSLLKAMTAVFDSLHAAYSTAET